MTFIDAHQDHRDGGLCWGAEPICRVLAGHGLRIAPATYYAARTRPRRDRVVVGRDQTGRLMRRLELAGVGRGKPKRSTRRDDTAARPTDLVQRDFTAARPDQLWVCDLTYI